MTNPPVPNLPRSRPSYCYRVVASNGAGIYGGTYKRCGDAKRAAERVAEVWVGRGPFEIERMLELPGGGRRYWMRRRSRWVLWDALADETVRKPDWLYD